MKHSLLITLNIFLCSISYSQITQEFVFPKNTEGANFGLICLDKSGLKYSILTSDSIKLYNTDHSVFKKFKYKRPKPIAGGYNPPIFLTENLFDSDNDLEYIITTFNTGDIDDHVEIINASQVVEKSFPMSDLNLHNPTVENYLQNSFLISPIFNVGDHAQLIIHNLGGGFTLYNLPGKLKCDCDLGTSAIIGNISSATLLKTFPNPANEYFKVSYILPEGVDQANFELFNNLGTRVKVFDIDRSFSDLLINTSDLKSGIYFYTIKSGAKVIGNNKIVIEK